MTVGIRYFIEVARLGSIRAASEHLSIAASAVSRQVQLLEEEYGATLFQRLPRGMELTPAGQVFLTYANNIMEERRRVLQGIGELNGLRRGHVRISSIDGVVADQLSGVINKFRQEYPNITFEVRAMGTAAVLETVQSGKADIGIAFHSTPTDGIRVAGRMKDPLCAVVGLRHPLASQRMPALADVLKFPIALPNRTFGIRILFEKVCKKAQLQPNIILETDSIEALRGHARAGGGLTMLPSRTVQRDVLDGNVKAFSLSDSGLQNASVDICVDLHRPPPSAAAAFLSVLCKNFEEHADFDPNKELWLRKRS